VIDDLQHRDRIELFAAFKSFGRLRSLAKRTIGTT
jgi:hypothetical protein